MKRFKGLACLFFMFTLMTWSAICFAEEIVIGFTAPLSGPAAEYGQDCVNGVDMAVKELNAAGGVTVKGKRYTFRLERLDDRADPTLAKNNSLRFVSQHKAPVVFVPIATTIGSVMSIPQTPGNEFLIAAYTSIHTFFDKGHPMIVTGTPNFMTFVQIMSDIAWQKGNRKLAMVATMGAYGDAWRKAMHHVWVNKGGRVVGDFPANYYTETDFSAQISAALSKKPDILLIGGPAPTTALVIEQARNLGYKGGFMTLDQAKPDFIARILKDVSLMEGLISSGAPAALPLPISPIFAKKFKDTYKREMTWECALNYNMMHVIGRAIVAADSVKAVDIRRNIGKALPTTGDKYPNELFGIDERGVMYCGAVLQTVENGKFSKADYVLSFPKTKLEFEKYKRMSKSTDAGSIRWFPIQ